MACTDCVYYSKCMESSRMLPCRDFRAKEGEGGWKKASGRGNTSPDGRKSSPDACARVRQ